MTAPDLRGGSTTAARVLVVDDDAGIRELVMRMLEQGGHHVLTAADGAQALEIVREGSIEVVVSDIGMDGMDGIALMREIRGLDFDVPIILLTGIPSLQSAQDAVEFGAFRYLTKPTDLERLGPIVTRAVVTYRMARLQRDALHLRGANAGAAADLAGLDVGFERALQRLWIAFQPIVRSGDGALYGYEALMRSEEPALPHPGAMLDAAERLGRLQDLGRTIRARAATKLPQMPPGCRLFLNLHPDDLLDDRLLAPDGPLAAAASRVVLEITERATISKVCDVQRRVARLKELGFQIAIDDLGAGYAGLSSFVTLEPEIVKLDMSLIRDVDTSPTKRRIIGSVVSLCRQLGVTVVAEGVETMAERETIARLDADLLQGYFIARPGPPFPAINW
jgi:EAL domain-containing protein (putative c-di-GMP-specific phosphodiesterase class I)